MHGQSDAFDPKLTLTMPSLPKYSVRHEESVCNTEPLTPDAFGDPHFGPKQVCAGALCAGCQ